MIVFGLAMFGMMAFLVAAGMSGLAGDSLRCAVYALYGRYHPD